MADRIIGMELTPVRVPFKELILQTMKKGGGLGMAIPAEEEWLGADCAILKLFTSVGIVGFGEAFVWYPETGISPNQVIDVIKDALFHYVIGEDPFNIEHLLYKMNINVARNEVAKGLIDIACHDLMGKIVGCAACDLIGGRAVNEIPLTALIPLANVDEMVEVAKMFAKIGYQSFRVKLGKGVNEDIQIMEAIRSTLGNDVPLRVDYNQAYSPTVAVNAINAIERFKIDCAEQPVRADNFVGMAYVQKRVNIPLMAHEGFFSLQDFVTLVELGAVGILGVNSERPGGVRNALKAMDYASLRGMGIIIHNQPLGIASAVHVHLAAARYHSLGHAIELFGEIMLEDDLITNRLKYDKGVVRVPDGPGWGVELDEKALEKYQTAPTVTIGRTN